MLLSLTHKTIW